MSVHRLTPKEGDVLYAIKRHARARRAVLKISSDGRVLVTIPKRMALKCAHRFVADHADWIEKYLAVARSAHCRIKISTPPYHQCRARALKFFCEMAARWNMQYGFRYKKVTVRNQSTRWGSCSVSGTLSFNYRLMFLPLELADYVVVHELCHLKEMNHSHHFWALVAKAIPNYPKIRRELKKYSCT